MSTRLLIKYNNRVLPVKVKKNILFDISSFKRFNTAADQRVRRSSIRVNDEF